MWNPRSWFDSRLAKPCRPYLQFGGFLLLVTSLGVRMVNIRKAIDLEEIEKDPYCVFWG
jgi:hypothetical protein